MPSFVIGVDFGTDSVRTVIVDAANGKETASSVFQYPRWHDGKYCRPDQNQFRQHPLDYLEGLETTIRDAIRQAGPEPQNTSKESLSIPPALHPWP